MTSYTLLFRADRNKHQRFCVVLSAVLAATVVLCLTLNPLAFVSCYRSSGFGRTLSTYFIPELGVVSLNDPITAEKLFDSQKRSAKRPSNHSCTAFLQEPEPHPSLIQNFPSSLMSNWNIFAEAFPELVRRWRNIEEQMTAGEKLDIAELGSLMYLALTSFVSAVTLERYSETAQSIAILGIAHRLITREWQIMIACYEHAAKFLDWSSEAAAVNPLSRETCHAPPGVVSRRELKIEINVELRTTECG